MNAPGGASAGAPWVRRAVPAVAAGSVLLAAAGLRLFGADAQSLWYDEGTSAALVHRSLAEIARGAAGDIHPPLYYWLLALWARVFGDGVVALRSFSAVAGMLAVAGVMAVGRRLWGTAVGLAAGLAAASSPFLVWYGQEVRMYMLAAAWGAALVWQALGLRPKPMPQAAPSPSGTAAPAARRGWRVWAPWTACATAALYTHYLVGLGAVATSNTIIALGVWGPGRPAAAADRRFLGAWALANATAAALFAPWLRLAWPAIRDWPALGPPVPIGRTVRDALAAFTAGTPTSASVGTAALTLAGIVAVAGVLYRGRDGSHRAGAIAAAWAGTPLVLLLAVSASRPAWNPKFLIGGALGFDLLVGAGVVGLAACAGRLGTAAARRWRTAGLGSGAAPVLAGIVGPACAGLAVVGAAAAIAWPRVAALGAMYGDPAHQRDDYRGIAAAVDAAAGPDDAVILNAPTQVEVFGYYDRGRHVMYPLPHQRPPDRAATLADVADIGGRHRDLYGVLWATAESDPEGLVEGWLNAHRHKVFDAWHGGVRLAMWAAARRPLTPQPVGRPVFGSDELVLVALAAGPPAVAAGEVVTIEAVWAAAAAPRADYTVFVHLLDAAGRRVAGRDMRPIGGSASTSRWPPIGVSGVAALAERLSAVPSLESADAAVAGAGHVDRIGLRVPPDAAPGAYTLQLGLYDPATGTRLAVSGMGSAPTRAAGGDAIVAGRVDVKPAGAR